MSDYMPSAASNSANTEQLSSVPYAPVGNISAEIQARVTANAVDDAGFGFAYGSCKLLDMLGYGSFIGAGNTKKKEITMQYLGLDTASLSDSQNPLIYGTSINLNLLPILLIRKSILISTLTLNGRSTWLMLIMSTIGTVRVLLRFPLI